MISETDAAGTGLTPPTLAQQYLATPQTAIAPYRHERSAAYLTRAAIIALVCTLGLVLAILVLANVMPQVYRWRDRQQARWVPRQLNCNPLHPLTQVSALGT